MTQTCDLSKMGSVKYNFCLEMVKSDRKCKISSIIGSFVHVYNNI